MIPATLEALQIFCSARYQIADLIPKEPVVHTHFKHPFGDFPILLRLISQKQILQILAILPGFFTPQTAPEVARILHMINRDSQLPGFGMDEREFKVFYRLHFPLTGNKIDPQVLKNYFQEVEECCPNMLPVIVQVASGELTCDEALRLIFKLPK